MWIYLFYTFQICILPILLPSTIKHLYWKQVKIDRVSRKLIIIIVNPYPATNFCPEKVFCCIYSRALQTIFFMEANTMNWADCSQGREQSDLGPKEHKQTTKLVTGRLTIIKAPINKFCTGNDFYNVLLNKSLARINKNLFLCAQSIQNSKISAQMTVGYVLRLRKAKVVI